MQISNEDIQIVPSVKLLGITIGNRLNFNEHMSNICKSAADQLKHGHLENLDMNENFKAYTCGPTSII